MTLLSASLYLLCLAFLFGSAVFVYSRNPFARLNASFALLAWTLLGWVGTLFIFSVQTGGTALLWLGRANFAAAALAAPAAYAFVLALAAQPVRHVRRVWAEAGLLALLSLLTPLVDKAETVQASLHISSYGPLFPLYLLHILGFTAAALLVALRSSAFLPVRTRVQLRLMGIGIFLTVLVGFITDAALPYWFHDFRFIHFGTLSTIFFLVLVAYAAVSYRLFNVRVFVTKAVIYALLVAVALELYQIAVTSLTLLLPLGDPTHRHLAAAGIALVINAVTQQPLRSWLERLADRLAAGRRGRHTRPSVRSSRGRSAL